MGVFKINDLVLTKHLIEVKKGLSEASASFRMGHLNDMLSYLADVENEARQAQWRIIEIIDDGKRKLEAERAVGKAQPE